MKINIMIRSFIAFYFFLILLVSYGLYSFNVNVKAVEDIREAGYSKVIELNALGKPDEASSVLTLAKSKIDVLEIAMNKNLVFIYIVMLIASLSFILVYIAMKNKIFTPISQINSIMTEYKEGKEDIEEIASNNDEIGLMIKEFFVMKRKLDDDYGELEKLAFTDPLTDILNRRAFFEVSESILQLSLRNKNIFSLMIIDIDYFKKVNDVHGHLTGDEILKFLVKNVSKEIRDSDVFARYGGEEFIVMLPDTNEMGALSLGIKVKEYVEKNPYVEKDLNIPLTISIGVATLKKESLLKDLIHRADEALYSAKENGRNRVEIG